MQEQINEVLVDGVRCQVMRREGERLLVQPLAEAGRSLNVSRWVTQEETVAVKAPSPVFSADEIRQLAAVLRDVFYEDADKSPRQVMAGPA